MRTVGIIAEYNPLHSGHAYHIREAKRLTHSDYVIAVMSPDYVQRGEPAVFDKYTRAKMALSCGADLVLEIPVCYATGSAEYFAQGAVGIINALNVVDFLSFGTEGTENIVPYQRLAGVLNEEPKEYLKSLKENLKQGMPYPLARSLSVEDPEGLLRKPNASLGVEYCRALLKFDSKITPVPVSRKGNGYQNEEVKGDFCSALAIRKELFKDQGEKTRDLSFYIPSGVLSLFETAKESILSADDFLPFLNQKLFYQDGYDGILDITKDLSNRIRRQRDLCVGKSFEEIVSILQTKQVTKSRIRRALFHLILDIRESDVRKYRDQGKAFYARVLGFRKDSSALLDEIKRKSSLPLIMRTARDSELLDETGKRMLLTDIKASHLYRSVQSGKYHLPFTSEYRKTPVIL